MSRGRKSKPAQRKKTHKKNLILLPEKERKKAQRFRALRLLLLWENLSGKNYFERGQERRFNL